MFPLFLLFLLLPQIALSVGYNAEIEYGNSDVYIMDILSTSGSQYYVIGWMNSPNSQGGSGDDVLVAKIDSDGTVLWTSFFGHALESDRGYAGTFSHDGHILIYSTQNLKVTVTKLNAADGEFVWGGNSLKIANGGGGDQGPQYDVGGITCDPSSGQIIGGATAHFTSDYTYFYQYSSASPPAMTYTRYGGSYRSVEDLRHTTGSTFLAAVRSIEPRGTVYDMVLEKYTYGLGKVYGVYVGFPFGITSKLKALELSDGDTVLAAAQYGSNCIVLVKLDPSPFSIYFSMQYCTGDEDGESLYVYDVMELSDYFVVSGRHVFSSLDHGFILRVDKTTGNLIKAEHIEDVYAFTSLASTNNGLDGDIMGAGYRKDEDGFFRGVLMKFQNDGRGCGVRNMFSSNMITNSTITPVSYGTHSKSLGGPGSWQGKTYSYGRNGDPQMINKKCTLECYGERVINGDDSNTCSEHGVCQDWDDCDCDPAYPGAECEQWSCYGIPNSEVNSFCGNNQTGFFVGFCVDIDTCFCVPGYSAKEVNKECTEWMCGKFEKEDDQGCSKRGNCISSQECQCLNDYEGQFCETWSCGADWKETSTCSGHGKCTEPNKCICKSGFSGDMCETNMMYYTIMAPVLSGVGLGVFSLILMLLLCIVFVIFACICAVYLGYWAVCCLGCVVFIQKGRMKKFGKLKNIDILLKEQQMESDETVAHLKISNSLFEIPYEQINLDSIIGEGGSSSVVYRAQWRKQTVAFKCFKTRQVCSDQNSFDEFESEVKVMSSISHPNIIRFFGGSLQPPRVGIVMEFCVNGDLVVFIKSYEREHEGQFYPLEEKVRMLHEIASALEYLHSRKILHRDLKLENVLVDLNENCKLMDFGLSKIVERLSRAQTKSIGTNIYMSPEIVTSGHYDEKTDVFSFGILMFILISQVLNPYGTDERIVEVRVSQDPTYRPNIEEVEKLLVREGDKWMRSLIVSCWDHCPKVRRSFSEILEIIEERTVVEDAMDDFDDDDKLNLQQRMSATKRTDSGKARKTRGGGGQMTGEASELAFKLEIEIEGRKKSEREVSRLKKKDRVLRRQLFIVQKEKERLTRVLSESGVDYQGHAPSAPTRESKTGIKPEIKKELAHESSRRKRTVSRKPAPLPPSVPTSSSRGPPPIPGRGQSFKRNVLFQK